MFYRFNGLGALPQTPPMTMLQAGYEWVRYQTGADTQATACPPEGNFGCLMYNGFAWGYRKALPGSEFAVQYVKPTAPTTSTSTGSASNLTKITQDCVALWADWAHDNPDQYKCLTAHQSQKLVEMCVAWKTGKMSFKDYVHDTVLLRKNACIRYECRTNINSWLRQLPGGGACVGDADRAKLLQWCIDAKNGAMTEKRYLQKAHDLITLRCKTAPAPTPTDGGGVQPPPSGGGGSTPTNGDVLPSGGNVHDAGADGAAPTSLLRQLGPVVGIGLLIALGLTVASQSKKKRKARS